MKAATQKKKTERTKNKAHKKNKEHQKTKRIKKQNASKNKAHPQKTAAGLHDWLLSYLIQYELN